MGSFILLHQPTGGSPHCVLSFFWIQKSPPVGQGWWWVKDGGGYKDGGKRVWMVGQRWRLLPIPVLFHFPSLILVCFIYDPHFSQGQTFYFVLFPMNSTAQLKWQAGSNGCPWLRWCQTGPLLSHSPTPSPPLDISLQRWA